MEAEEVEVVTETAVIVKPATDVKPPLEYLLNVFDFEAIAQKVLAPSSAHNLHCVGNEKRSLGLLLFRCG